MAIASSRLERILLDANLVSKDQLATAHESQNGKSLTRALVDLGFVGERDVALAVAKKMRLDFVDLENYEIDNNAASLVADEIARRYSVLPIGYDGEDLLVAMADPANVFALDDLRIITGRYVKPVVCTESEIVSAIEKYSRAGKAVEELVEGVTGDIDAGDVTSAEDAEEAELESAPVVKLVNLILTEAVRSRANDIHIEPQDRDVRIRYRIDGVLHEIMRSPKKVQGGMISRIKIVAGMDIAERRVPQDGRFGINMDGAAFDFRVATLPTIYGEKIVLRLLRKEAILMDLNDLGFLKGALERFTSSFTKPYGAILVTGPTGCGKTTSLYAAVNVLNSPEKNLITVEDPVEYRLPGINQVQVNVKADLTFAAALRSILRHDPDIVMIGEIRDEETALIAIESALTGHLVLSTLHTNSAPAALTRLIEMGIEPFLISSAVDCVVAQRLARVLCPHCKEEYAPAKKALEEISFPVSGNTMPKIFRAKGCKKCNNTGYYGRLGLYEVMLVSEQIERLTVKRATTDEIQRVAVAEGMSTLRMDGFEKVRAGKTSIEEVMRVTT